jgi:nucleoside-diphosphate-sugar epimerase
MTCVLITGATGFVGSALLPALAGKNYAVRAVTRRLPDRALTGNVEFIAVPDLAEAFDWSPTLAGVDAVVHLAGIAHVGADVPGELYDRVNHAATARLTTAAQRAGVRHFVFMSSVRAQSGPAAEHPLTEADEPRPTDAYGRSKCDAEFAVRGSGVPYTILRPVVIYGPGVKGNIASLMRLAATPWPLPFGAFANQRSLLALDNLIDAIDFLLTRPNAPNDLYLVADAAPVSLSEIVATLREAHGHRRRLLNVPPSIFKTVFEVIGRHDAWERLGGSLVASPAKLMATGWRPRVDTLAGLAAMARNAKV